MAKPHPKIGLHIVADNYATRKNPNVNTWLEHNPRITMHSTPTSRSWMNLVEISVGIITRQAIRRGSFTSIIEITKPSRCSSKAGTSGANPSGGPRRPTKSSPKANRKRASNTRQ